MEQDNSRDETVRTSPAGTTVDFDLDGTRTAVQPLQAESARTAPAPASAEASGNHVALQAGYQLHEYTIERILGAGGFGITYLARDNNLQCQVAIKEYLPNDMAVRLSGQTVMPRTDADSEGYQLGLERFLVEARVLAGFRHPNIVRVNRFFEANRTAYMVMDYEQGESLRNWLPKQGSIDEATLRRMFLPLLDGIEVVHNGGIVHRDIKPANIYVRDSDGSLVLLDFGAARQTTGAASKSLTSIITPGYAPFEQYHTRGAQGPWTDLYALGGVLYWLVTGQKPLEAPTRVKSDSMAPATEVAKARFSQAFLAAIDWALTVDEDDRPRSVAELRPVFLGEQAVPPKKSGTAADAGPAPTQTVETSPADKRKNYWLAGAVAAAVVVAGAFMVLSRPTAPAASPQTVVAAAEAGKAPSSPQTAEVAGMNAGTREAPAKTPKSAKAATDAKSGAATASAAAASGAQATLVFDIAPAGEQGEVRIDGRKIGMAPPLREYKLPAGKHKVEIYGSKPPNVYHFWLTLEPNEKKRLWAKFANEL